MDNSDLVRNKLFNVCVNFVNNRINTLQSAIAHAQASAASETKSSMGDKYETARSMAQQEADHSRSQLADAMALKNVLDQCPMQPPGEMITTGSIVYTNHRNYFIAIAIGPVEIDDQTFLVISKMSPVGRLLMGKRAGDQFTWQDKQIIILRVQ